MSERDRLYLDVIHHLHEADHVNDAVEVDSIRKAIYDDECSAGVARDRLAEMHMRLTGQSIEAERIAIHTGSGYARARERLLGDATEAMRLLRAAYGRDVVQVSRAPMLTVCEGRR